MDNNFWDRVKDEPKADEGPMGRGEGEYGVDSMYKRRRLSADPAEDSVQAHPHSPRSIPRLTRRSPMTKIAHLINSPNHHPPPKPYVSPPPTQPSIPNVRPSQSTLERVVSPSPGVPDPDTAPAQHPSLQDDHPTTRASSGPSSSTGRAGNPIHATWNAMLSVSPSMDRTPTLHRLHPFDAAPRRIRELTPKPSHKTPSAHTSPQSPKRHLQSHGLPEAPLYFAEQERLHQSPEPPIRPAMSYYPPFRRRSLVPQEKAWFTLGRTDLVDMPQWDQAGRRAYERGYEDALAAVQRGVVGVDEKEYSCPVLVNREPRPLRYRYVNGRRLSVETSSLQQLYTGLTNGESRRPSIDDSYLQYNQPLASPWIQDEPLNHTVPPPMRRNSQPYIFPSNAYPAPTTTSSPNGTVRNVGQRQLISCYPCRSRKMKCDGQKPCGQCVKRGGVSDCEYAAEVRRRGKGKKSRGSEAGRSGTEDSSQESLVLG